MTKKKNILYTSSRVKFSNKIKTFQERQGLINLSFSKKNAGTLSSDSPLKHATQSVVGNVRPLEKGVLFVIKQNC